MAGTPTPTGGFEVFEHTADVGIRAWADTWSDLLIQAARGMVSLIVAPEAINPVQRLVVEITAADREELMMGWLKELLCRFEIEGFLPASFDIREAGDTRLSAEIAGEPLDRDRHEPDMEVKAVTWHEFRVHQASNGGWEATVIFDI